MKKERRPKLRKLQQWRNIGNIRVKSDDYQNFYEAKTMIKIEENKLKSKIKDLENLQSYSFKNYKGITDLSASIKKITDTYCSRINQSLSERIRSLRLNMRSQKDDFEYFKKLDLSKFPENRKPAEGIKHIPLEYHKQKVELIFEDKDKFGKCLHPAIEQLIKQNYPTLIPIISKYCRPMSTTDAVFNDFNREQVPSQPSTRERIDDIIELIMYFTKAVPYRPIHYDDWIYCKQPLVTGTGYHNKRSFDAKAHAKYTHPELYKDYPLSKGFFFNYTYLTSKRIIHDIKTHGVPFGVEHEPTTKEGWKKFASLLNYFYLTRPTSLYVRVHISKRDAELKIRPVYGVDDVFLIMETMLTFPLLVQARVKDCSIMHSYETMRGANWQLDKEAQSYKSYFTLDYTRYDQSLPFAISDTYFQEFLPRLIIINKGYQPTFSYIDVNLDQTQNINMYRKMRNLLYFYHTWFKNMTFLTPDGYAYRRTCAGIPSGMLGTQEIDSYCNLYLICDGLLEYGLSKEEIKQIKMFVLGDDNAGFTHYNIYKLQSIMHFVIQYLKDRWNMTIKPEKCVFTDNRQYISTLSYECNFGYPKKDIEKLYAHLFYPEHGTVEKYMASRAVGMAYAACGSDEIFHRVCEDVYNLFIKVAEVPKEHLEYRAFKHLPGIFYTIEDKERYFDIAKFPTIEEVREQTIKWKGELSFHPKWDDSHFIYLPNQQEDDKITIYEMKQFLEDEDFIPPHLL